jgi:hypothetical protein
MAALFLSVCYFDGSGFFAMQPQMKELGHEV